MPLNKTTATTVTKDVIIIGGSLSSLMHALTLHHLGCSVLILEQTPSHAPPSHMAGIAIGPAVLDLLSRFDRASDIPLGIPSDSLQTLDATGHVRPFLRLPRLMTSWDALYFRLRANFDGLRSEYVAEPPGPRAQHGESIESASARAKYEIGQRVVGVEEDTVGRVRVAVQDCRGETEPATGREYQLLADLVIAADGANSIVRKIFSGSGNGDGDRQYAGYVVWRGVVPESQVSEATRRVFSRNITYSILNGTHVIVYNIPSPNGSIELGTRLLNFAWYTNVPSSSLDEVMTDASGKRHRISLSPEHFQSSIWARQRSIARDSLPEAHLEIMNQISSPFVHLITDFWSPRTAFLNGKVLLVGDASALLRPHTAYATSQAAEQAQLTEGLVKGEMGWREWERRITRKTYVNWRQSIWFGEFYQRGWVKGFGSAVRYWIARGMDVLRSWMNGFHHSLVT
ncbi:uncharacterized protein LDX57_006035 [Aspergillus melleus]|uniref:uncharacterized protein n=1 Tax=Aspergillus melleus TaxID=138277 RepID=UPI001E8DE3CF|nr:uncharacterized protein LDX57_006035 [Aspergillus melleus]KAH8428334.1 hypothetical protein LDX57_006035 [Aspergillus melleus]